MFNESPLAEQEICVNCGLCCDGTLFNHAMLQAGEQGNLPEKIEEQYVKDDEKDFFTLPCFYFCGKCTIYNQKRPVVCSTFRCQLLKNFSNHKITQEKAIATVVSALKLRDELYQLYLQITGQEFTLSFSKMLVEVGNIVSSNSENTRLINPIDLLKIKCTLYETLLIKNFKSIKNFEKMIIPSME